MIFRLACLFTVVDAVEDGVAMLQTAKVTTATIPAIKLATGEGSCADNVMIKTEDECKAAAEGLGIEYWSGGTSRDHGKQGIEDERPGGCYSVPRGGKDRVYFNDVLQAGTRIWSSATGVCHTAVTIPAIKLATGEGSCADNVMIKTEDECKAAAEGLGIEYWSGGTSRDHGKQGIEDERPGGCYSVPRGGKDRVYFNDVLQAGTRIWSSATGVCHTAAAAPVRRSIRWHSSSCRKKENTAVRGHYLTVQDSGNEIDFNKHEQHPAPFTHVYDTLSECQEKCLAIPSCAGFVDNRAEKYCVFKDDMERYENENKDSWIC